MDTDKRFGTVAGGAAESGDRGSAWRGTDGTQQSRGQGWGQSWGRNSTVDNTMTALKETEQTAPTFSGEYDQEISDIYDRIVNRPKFTYDYSTDPLYGQYREQYVQQGRQAMRDTVGQAAALTGGYGNTYGEAAGQQAYDAYLTRLNEIMPQLYSRAYAQYEDEGDRLNQQYSLAADQRNTAYSRYRDEVGDRQYEETLRRQEATDRAALGDWSAYAALYGQSAAKVAAILQNPQAAYAQGLATGEEIYAYTGEYPIGYEGAATSGGFEGNWYGNDPVSQPTWHDIYNANVASGNSGAAGAALTYAQQDGVAEVDDNGDIIWKN